VTQPPGPGGVTVVPEIGQGYAQALQVRYPSVLAAQMGEKDYDTVLFDFPGGSFRAWTNSKLNLVADLLDAQGTMITRAIGANLQFNQSLPPGRYGIIVRVMNYAGTGPYELVLGSESGPRFVERP
jgi:lysophospholipase L1-like esterase